MPSSELIIMNGLVPILLLIFSDNSPLLFQFLDCNIFYVHAIVLKDESMRHFYLVLSMSHATLDVGI
jgi:hypothetical protein